MAELENKLKIRQLDRTSIAICCKLILEEIKSNVNNPELFKMYINVYQDLIRQDSFQAFFYFPLVM